MLTADHIRFLSTDAGEALLAEAAALPNDLLTRLKRLRLRHPPEMAAAAVELLALRARAASKFSRADRMFFTAQGLEQATGDAIARWRAGRFPEGARVLDLCCGIGGDAVWLGGRGPVEAVDVDPAAAACAEANARVCGVQDTVSVRCADVTLAALTGDGAFFDPSRRPGGRRVRSGGDYQPSLSFVDTIREHIPHVAVKVSPSLDDAELERAGGRVEFVSDHGECKEAVLWSGEIGPREARSATVLPAGVSLARRDDAPAPPQSPPRAWVLEPDPAVIRAHLIAELAKDLWAGQLDPHIAWLTTDGPVQTLFATGYRVLEWMPFSLRRVQSRLRELGRRVTAIKRRGVPLDPQTLARTLTGAGEQPAVVVLTRVSGAAVAILCEPPGTSHDA